MRIDRITVFLAAEALLLCASAGAAMAKTPAGGWDPPQNWCYCLQYRTPTAYNPIPYDLGSFPDLAPGCAKVKFDAKRKNAGEELHSCEDLRKCWQEAAKGTEEKKKLEKTLAGHRKMLDACLKPLPEISAETRSNLDKTCRRIWKPLLEMDTRDIAAADTRMRSERAACFAKAPTISTAKLLLRSSARDERIRAALFLARTDTADPEAIPVLIDAIRRDEEGCKAIAALGNYGPAANAAVPALADLGVKHSVCPGSATLTLERIGTPDARTALRLSGNWERKWNLREKRLFQALSDRDPAVRGNAAAELHYTALKLNPETSDLDKRKEITAALTRLLRDPQKTVRYRVASYLAHADTPAAEALPVLIEAVKDNEVTDHSCIAISALGGYGPAAGAAVPILSDPGVMERHEYFRAPNPCSPSAALERIGTREAMAALGAQRNRELKWKWSVQEMRLLAKARGDQNPDARESAMRELRSIALKSPKHKRKNIFAALQLLLRYTDKTGRHSAALRSISISFTAAGAVLEEDSPYASPGYLHPASFGTVRAAETQAFDKLTNGKGSTYFRLREYTAELEQIGAPEAMAAPALLQNNELLASALAAPFAFLVFIPALAPLTLLFFAWLFLWSRARHKEGRKFIYRPLLIPVLGWIYISYVVMFELNKHGSFRQINGAYICFWLSVLTTLTGLLPWCASWCLLRLRGRRRSAGA